MVTSAISRPVRRIAAAAGSLTVADTRTNTGSEPYFAQIRRRRRTIWATCEPNTPRYPWHSSTTTTFSRRQNDDHAEWWGSIDRWSMSGLVST